MTDVGTQTGGAGTAETPPAAAQVENQGPMSLAQIAGLDVTDVEELRSMQLPVGIYGFEVTAAKLDKQMVKDGTELRYTGIVELKVIEIDTIVEKDVQPSDVLGRTFTEKFFIDPAKAHEGIGYLKGFVADIGCDNKGNMGGVEGAPPGYLDRALGHRFKSKIIKKPGKDGEKYSRLQLIKKAPGQA